jgi:RHS repeat-associated protein
MTADAEHPNLHRSASGGAPVQTAPGGRLLATYDAPGQASPGYHYNLTDWLGTKRMQTTSGGNQQETCISNPFGDGLSCTGGADATEQHFTGKDRDVESGLDYFYARYYSSVLGRFMTPDWSGAPAAVPYASFGDPQSLNLYAYVGNNPNTGIDVDGHVEEGDASAAAVAEAAQDAAEEPAQQSSQPQNGSSSSSTTQNGAPPNPTPPGDNTSAQKQTIVDNDRKEAQRRLTNPSCSASVDAAFKAAGGDGTATGISVALGKASSVDFEAYEGDAETAAKGPALTDGNVTYLTDGYFTSRNTDGPGTLIGEAMHMKQFGNSSGGIGDAAFADAMHISYPTAKPGQSRDDAASPYFHKTIEAACPAQW